MTRRTGQTDPAPPEWTPEEFAQATPFPGLLSATVAQEIRATYATAQRRRRGAQHAPTKVAISLRVQRDTLARYRASGRGWQTRMAAVLDRHATRLTTRAAASTPTRPAPAPRD